MEIVISAVSAFIIGYLISFFVSRIRKQAAETESAVLRSQLDAAVRQVEEIRKESAERISAFKEEAERQRQKALEAADAVYMNSLAAKDKACSDRLAEQEKRHNEAMSALQARFDEVMQKVTAHVRTATDDMLKQMHQLKKLGPLSGVLKMIPGMPSMPNLSDETTDRKMKETEAIIYSMTPAERQDPSIITLSRKQRIAKGCGKDLAAVNRLLKQFEQSKQMMKRLSNIDPNTGMPMANGKAQHFVGGPNRKKVRHKKKKKK